MGKGDKKTKKGKIVKSSYGNSRLQRKGNGISNFVNKNNQENGLTDLPENPLKSVRK